MEKNFTISHLLTAPFLKKKIRQALLAHFGDKNTEVQGCSISLARSQNMNTCRKMRGRSNVS